MIAKIYLAAFVAPLTSGHVLRSADSESGVSGNRGVSEAFTSAASHSRVCELLVLYRFIHYIQ